MERAQTGTGPATDPGTAAFDVLPAEVCRAELLTCLHAPGWAAAMTAGRPYRTRADLLATAYRLGSAIDDDDLTEALAAHPRIGERPDGDSAGAALSRREQGGVDPGDAELADRLRSGNRAYEDRFGHVFLIRAAGRDGPEILAELERRLGHDDVTERSVVRDQLAQITGLRLEALLDRLGTGAPPADAPTADVLPAGAAGPPPASALTTHVLDSTTGRPAPGVGVRLEALHPDGWREVARGATDGDGRLRALGPAAVAAGTYRLVFATGAWFDGQGRDTFYPEVTVTVTLPEPGLADGEHAHVPLLLAPYAYSTYRGS